MCVCVCDHLPSAKIVIGMDMKISIKTVQPTRAETEEQQ